MLLIAILAFLAVLASLAAVAGVTGLAGFAHQQPVCPGMGDIMATWNASHNRKIENVRGVRPTSPRQDLTLVCFCFATVFKRCACNLKKTQDGTTRETCIPAGTEQETKGR